MTSIPRMSKILTHLFEDEAAEVAKQAGMRERTMSFSQLAFLLVLGWWKHPSAGPSVLARFAGSLGLCVCKQDIQSHFTERTATWLLSLLQAAVREVVQANAVALPLLTQFTAVLIEDGSSISLPSALKRVWGGCGGSASKDDHDPKTQAGLKVTVRWDLLSGQMHGPHVQAGRRHELSSVLRTQTMKAGSLWIADLGYWTLNWLHHLQIQGVFFLMRYKAGIVLWSQGRRVNLLSILPSVTADRLELLVDVGAGKVIKGVRLLAERVPVTVATDRQERIRRAAIDHGSGKGNDVAIIPSPKNRAGHFHGTRLKPFSSPVSPDAVSPRVDPGYELADDRWDEATPGFLPDLILLLIARAHGDCAIL